MIEIYKNYMNMRKKMKKAVNPKEKKVVYKKDSENNLPSWFKTENDINQTTKEEVEELDKILNELV